MKSLDVHETSSCLTVHICIEIKNNDINAMPRFNMRYDVSLFVFTESFSFSSFFMSSFFRTDYG